MNKFGWHTIEIIIAIITFLFVATIIYSAEIHGHFEVGYLQEGEDFVTDLYLEYSFWQIVLSSGIETLMEKSETSVFFSPYRNVYYAGLQLNITNHFYFKATHSCTHPVYSYKKQFYDHFEGGNRTNFMVGIEW
ncbi:MAG: hypothetical protein ACOC80_07525 [Petrotogales bacterium]